MTIEEIKKYMKENKITYTELSIKSKIPLNTLKNIFCGRTSSPRIDTMNAIEKALGINAPINNNLSPEEQELIDLILKLNYEETEELTKFAEYLISKRK